MIGHVTEIERSTCTLTREVPTQQVRFVVVSASSFRHDGTGVPDAPPAGKELAGGTGLASGSAQRRAPARHDIWKTTECTDHFHDSMLPCPRFGPRLTAVGIRTPGRDGDSTGVASASTMSQMKADIASVCNIGSG